MASSNAPPTIAPINKAGAKTPPDPPEPSVKQVAIIFAMSKIRAALNKSSLDKALFNDIVSNIEHLWNARPK